MTKRHQPRGSRYAPKNKTKKTSHWFRKLLLLSLLLLSIIAASSFSYITYLDESVRQQFEGKRWAIPARVYASSVDLYAGYKLNAPQFEQLLNMLHYRYDDNLAGEGTYYKTGSQISVKTRDFVFPDAHQVSNEIRLTFNDTSIASITDLAQGQELPLTRLDPVQIGSFYPSIQEDRILIKLSEAPDNLVKGLLAAEDRTFYSHFGISPKGVARALLANFHAGKMIQGGSTITQQLVKNFYLNSERSLARKVKEAIMALLLEAHYSKQEILEAYLNEIYLGQDGSSSVHGFGLASEFYFGRSVKDLSLDQVALLVALVRGPSEYDPRRYPNRALQRRNLVLTEMLAQNVINKAQTDTAQAAPLGVIPSTHRSINRYPAFLDAVKRQLRQDYREDDLTSEGLRIFTTFDTQLQEILEKTVATQLSKLEKHTRAKKLESAVIVTHRDNGEIAALVGGRENLAGGFNRALDALRPIGSLVKPAIYLTALQNPEKYTITSKVDDSFINVKSKDGGEDWIPKNYDHKEHGRIPLHTALAKSYNLATVHVGMDVGITNVANTLKNMGVTRPIELFPSLLLGASALAPMDVTAMYQTLAGDGFATPIKGIRAVLSADGKALQSYPFNVKQAVDPAATYIVNTILQEVMHKGTGADAYKTFPKDYGLVGKTGTTNDAKDSWFAGYTGDYLAVVWVGRDDNKPIGLTGAAGALPVWTSLMQQISQQPVLLNPPDNIKMLLVNPYSGQLMREGCGGGEQYPYIEGSQPTSYASCGNKQESEEEKATPSWFDDAEPQNAPVIESAPSE